MRKKKIYLHINSEERTLLLQSLAEMKNRLIQQGRYTDCVDDVILKVMQTPMKR